MRAIDESYKGISLMDQNMDRSMNRKNSSKIDERGHDNNFSDEQCGPDSRADALSAIGLILFTVGATVFWVANQ